MSPNQINGIFYPIQQLPARPDRMRFVRFARTVPAFVLHAHQLRHRWEKNKRVEEESEDGTSLDLAESVLENTKNYR